MMDIVNKKEMFNKNNEKIGQAVLYNHDKENDVIYIDGYMNDNQNLKQFAKYLLELIFEAFQKLGCNKICAVIPESDYKKMRLWSCLRFVKEFLLREHVKINGEYKNLYYMSIIKYEFINSFLNDNNVQTAIEAIYNECNDIWDEVNS